jgi:hypothetical protein
VELRRKEFKDFNLKVCHPRCVKLIQHKLYIYFHTRAVKTQQTICQIVSLCNIQQCVIYNYMFRPCKRAIFRLFLEPVIGQPDDDPHTRPKHVDV